MAEKFFGVTVKNSDGTEVPVRFIGEQHVREDLGFIPSMKDWLTHIEPQPWMNLTPRGGSEKIVVEGEI